MTEEHIDHARRYDHVGYGYEAYLDQLIEERALEHMQAAYDAEINQPLPHRAPSLLRINHYWRHR